jgi:hypothetical protein
MLRKINLLLFVSFFSVILVLPQTVNSQLTGVDSIDFTITPENPKPGELVVATLDMYGSDINLMDINWLLNGVTVQKGKGLRVYSFNAGKVGEKSTIEIIGQSPQGLTFSKKISFTPAEVNLLYEAKSYVPPFYKGKPSFPYQGSLRLVAIPNIINKSGNQVPKENLVYRWKEGSTVFNSASGYGRYIFDYKANTSLPKTSEITVEVFYPEESIVSSATIKAEPGGSKVIFYENDPEYGILLNKALNENIELSKEEIVISAIPLFFGTDSKNSFGLKYKWVMGNTNIESEESSVVLRNTTGQSGQTILNLKLSNTIDYFQSANNSLGIRFNKINSFSR